MYTVVFFLSLFGVATVYCAMYMYLYICVLFVKYLTHTNLQKWQDIVREVKFLKSCDHDNCIHYKGGYIKDQTVWVSVLSNLVPFKLPFSLLYTKPQECHLLAMWTV